MRIFKTKAYARAGLVGNPSDGYHGKTISLIVKNFRADVVIYEWPELEIIPTRQDNCRFDSLEDFLRDQLLNGYYGGLRLIKASIKGFAEHCRNVGIELKRENFSLRYSSNIPRQVGLAGSSAIVTATMRALCRFYDVTIPKEILPGLILSVEKDELGIGAGLQDRVAQVYEGLTYMDFDLDFMNGHGHGRYEPLDPGLLPPLYIAYQTELAESSEVFHNDIRKRYESGERIVIEAMETIAGLAVQARQALLARDYVTLASLMDRNFDTRRSIYNLNPRHVRMVELAREIGASAKFAGSGGSIIGAYKDEAMFARLKQAFEAENCAVIKPIIG
ncbi:MAG TPA: GHMP kinase [Blastocatellia bacterium]|nr:GHMP kinase [Blastocatellia bacterium]